MEVPTFDQRDWVHGVYASDDRCLLHSKLCQRPSAAAVLADLRSLVRCHYIGLSERSRFQCQRLLPTQSATAIDLLSSLGHNWPNRAQTTFPAEDTHRPGAAITIFPSLCVMCKTLRTFMPSSALPSRRGKTATRTFCASNGPKTRVFDLAPGIHIP